MRGSWKNFYLISVSSFVFCCCFTCLKVQEKGFEIGKTPQIFMLNLNKVLNFNQFLFIKFKYSLKQKYELKV